MDQIEPGRGLQDIVLRPVYLRAVNAIVQPEQQVPCTLYFFREWLPRLGSLRWALVLALRQLCSARLNDGVARGEVCRSQLATLLGVHEVTITRLLTSRRSDTAPGWRVLQPSGDDDQATAFLAMFIPRLRYKYDRDPQTGTTRRIGYIIDVVMDDPLVPEDEHRLAVIVANQLLSGGDFLSSQSLSSTEAPGSSPTGTTSLPNVKQHNAISASGVKAHNAISSSEPTSHIDSSRPQLSQQDASSAGVKAHHAPGLTLTNNYNYHGITIPLYLHKKHEIRRALTPLVKYATEVLSDDHSVGMFYSTLTQLYPDSLDLFVEALEAATAVGTPSPKLNLGAVFVNMIKSLAQERGVPLRLGKTSAPPSSPQPTIREAPPDQQAPTESPFHLAELPDSAAPERESVYVASVGLSTPHIWRSILEELGRSTSRVNYEMWLKNCRLVDVQEEVVVIGAPNRVTCQWVREKLRPAIAAAAGKVLGRPVAVHCEVIGERMAMRGAEIRTW